MVGSLVAQPTLEFRPSSQSRELVQLQPNKGEKGELEISWLADATANGGVGINATGSMTMSPYMELEIADLYNFYGQKINSIEKICFGLDKGPSGYNFITNITSARVIISQGASVTTATIIVSQTVPISTLVDGWNTVSLDSAYNIDYTRNLYIGYEIVATIPSFPAGIAKGDNPKQAWYILNGNPNNLTRSSTGGVFLIKAIGIAADPEEIDIAAIAVTLPQGKILQEDINIQGTVRNVGLNTITSFKYKYEIDGVSSSEEEVTGVDIAPNTNYSFTHPTPYTTTTGGAHAVKITVSLPNGVEDRVENNWKEDSLKVLPYSELVQRKVLLEGFTSSSCGPCVQGNTNLKAILAAVPNSKWTCIKYQMSWPGSGDPYYTAEGGVRRALYNITGVPHLVVDGTNSLDTRSYTANALNAAAAVPSPLKMTGIATVWPENRSVYIDIETTSISEESLSNLRIFAAIVEKTTTKNKTSNGESSFDYVMKKFLTSSNGNTFSITNGETKKMDYLYYFQGDYCLPANASSPINHTIEHSVENFNNLMVVYWVQNMTTKEVIQSGTSTCVLDINKTEVSNIKLNVYPNPASELINVVAEASMVKATLFNVLGQAVKEVNMNGATEYQISVNNFPQGTYLLKVDTDKGSTVKKVQIL